jgi:glycosyltransferase involved in cell wall biosynthesis
MTVGRLIRPKGFQELLQAWHLFEKRCLNEGTLVLVGDGPERYELNRVVKKLELQNVRFIGYVNYDDITEYYAAADVLVMPTLEDNWSLVVPEAMACGLPILCSCYNGCYPELIEHDGNGWIFDPLDETDTFNALQCCVINRDRLAKMGERSREIVSKYTPENAAKAILEACRLAFENN